ncbi:MAG: peptidylprolyl isomerase, partial [Magnetovibrio sp.]|nr:peptidylprolyl isomerase [Magnetovibrio sp.]
MIRFTYAFMALFLGTLLMTDTAHAQTLEDTLYLDLKDGRVVIDLRPDLAPKHVARIKQLVREGFYDGLTFHRVLDGFMAQGGDPEGTGMGGSGQNLPAEFSQEPFVRGILGMARSSDINSADSQFFIMF